MHWTIDELNSGDPEWLDELWRDALPERLGDADTRVFPAEFLLLHVCAHLARKHLFDFSLRGLCDIAAIVQSHPGFDWAGFIARCRRHGLTRHVALALRLASTFELPELSQVLDLGAEDLRQLLKRLHEDRVKAGKDDTVLRDSVAGVKLSEAERQEIERIRFEERKGGRRRWLERVFVGSAMVFSLLFAVVFLYWERLVHPQEGPFREQVIRLLDTNALTIDQANDTDFDEKVKGSKLEDWLLLQGIEGVQLPEKWQRIHFVAGRVTRWRGLEVAQIIADKPKVVVLVTDMAGFNTDGEKIETSRLSAAGWTATWQVSGKHLIFVSVQGEEKQLDEAFAELDRMEKADKADKSDRKSE